MNVARRPRFSAIDLFCGCGGLTLGLRRAGFKVVAAIDNDPLSTATYHENHRRTNLIRGDIRSIDPVNLMKELGLASGDLDLIAGCPPCQGFSTLRTLNGGCERRGAKERPRLRVRSLCSGLLAKDSDDGECAGSLDRPALGKN